jgi:uncharacterized protein (TIGR03067 family)
MVKAMLMTRLKTVTAVLLLLGMAAFGGGLFMRQMVSGGQQARAAKGEEKPPHRQADLTRKEGDESKRAASPRTKFEADREKLQGIWTTVTATKNGRERKEEKGVELEFKGEEVIIREPARKDAMVMSIKPSAFPGGDIAFGDERPAGRPPGTGTALMFTYGILRIEGDTLTLCIQSAYSVPRDFSDNNQVLWVLKRKQEPR